MQTHTIEGQFMLDRVGGLLARVGEIVRSCHERWDGSGYPDGFAGEQIPLASRIVFACDAYSAMTTDRPYRPAMSPAEALAGATGRSGDAVRPAGRRGPLLGRRWPDEATPASPTRSGRSLPAPPWPEASAALAPERPCPLSAGSVAFDTPGASARMEEPRRQARRPGGHQELPHAEQRDERARADEGQPERPGRQGVLDPEDPAREPIRARSPG